MTPSQKCKESGLNLKQLSDASGVSAQTLSNWFKSKPKLFDLIVLGAKEEQRKCQLREVD